MKKRIALLMAMTLMSFSLTGCIKVIEKGTEGEYTGEVAFDAAADSSSTWSPIVEELTNNAVDIAEIMKGDGITQPMAISGSGEVAEFESKANGKKNALIMKIDGVSDPVKIQIGSIYSGTDIRDIQSLKEFGSFTNQTEWSEYAKALNKEVDAQVVAPLAIDDSVVGKTITFVGAASASGGEITITPVSMTVE